MQLYLGGHLNFYDSQKRRSIDIRLAEPTQLRALLRRLNVPRSEIAVGSLNGKPILEFEQIILNDADSVR